MSPAMGAVRRALVDLAADLEWAASPTRAEVPLSEIAGPEEDNLVDMAKLFVARRGISLLIEGMTDPSDPDDELYLDGSLLAGPHATRAGPTFEQWLASDDANVTTYGAAS